MIRVLLFEESKKTLNSIKNMFSTNKIQQYEICWYKSFRADIFANHYFDVILVVQDNSKSEALDAIKNIVHLELPSPIILLSANNNIQFDENAMRLGAADSIPLNELSFSLVDRTIRHAIGRRNSESKLSFLATHDQLTGLANRYLFHEHLTRSISIAKRQHKIFGLLFLDLDKFKTINDSLGA